jgi:hypothetical protein
MNLYEKVDDLENIVDTIENLISELNKENQYYIENLNDIKLEAFGELEEARQKLAKKEKEEQEELENEFNRGRL